MTTTHRSSHGKTSAPGTMFAVAAMVTMIAVVCLPLSACGDLPRDVDGSLRTARGGVLRVGVTPAPSWVTMSADSIPAGTEVELIRSFAAGIDAEVEWVWGGAEENLDRLERGELDVVAAGLTLSSPWKARVALTRPHTIVGKHRHAVAVAPGENGLLVALERHIESRP